MFLRGLKGTVTIRAEWWKRLGGYDTGASQQEDRVLFTRALELGARFVRVEDEPTWVYRFHRGTTGNKSRGRLE